MKERPILFSGPMVRAILEGRKTQTRRVVKPQPNRGSRLTRMQSGYSDGHTRAVFSQEDEPNAYGIKFPYGQPRDRLWVKETHRFDGLDPKIALRSQCLDEISYRADMQGDRACDDCAWRPSIFMPRWASRITLEITGVHVEQLNKISDFDAFQEGVKDEPGTITGPYCRSFVQGFKGIWNSINGPGSWDQNPWVWVVEFRRMTK